MKSETENNVPDKGTKLLYIDPFSGVSGDMFLGALLSLGLPVEILVESVDKVIPGEVRFEVARVVGDDQCCGMVRNRRRMSGRS